MIVGTLVVLAYLVLAVGNAIQLTGERSLGWTRQLSMGAALLLLVQLVLGFSLLSGDHTITPAHYLFALAALITVGVEHAVAYPNEDRTTRMRLATMATSGTALLVLIAYSIGQAR
jgi:hypothetical protein